MNILKSLYCRIFQFVFKLALPFLPYKDPKILDNITDITTTLKACDKPLIVVDPVVYKLGLIDGLLDSLNNHKIEYKVFTDLTPNPTIDQANNAYKIFVDEKCNKLIAVGGGSSLDLAKAVGAKYARPKKSLQKLKGILKVRKKIPILYAVPTTAGTGSETTLACVIIDSNTKHKYAINDFPIIPKYAVLDSNMTKTLPKNVIATTGMDALTHAIEAFIGRGGNKKTRKDALDAIKLIFENLEDAYFFNGDESRKNMLFASFKAGRAFSKAYVGYVHALAHALGGFYNTPHGLANAVILPIVLKEYKAKIYGKLKKIAIYIGIADENTDSKAAANLLINKIEELNNKFEIPNSITIDENDIEKMSEMANSEANPLYPVPVLWDKKKLAKLYLKIGELNDRNNQWFSTKTKTIF